MLLLWSSRAQCSCRLGLLAEYVRIAPICLNIILTLVRQWLVYSLYPILGVIIKEKNMFGIAYFPFCFSFCFLPPAFSLLFCFSSLSLFFTSLLLLFPSLPFCFPSLALFSNFVFLCSQYRDAANRPAIFVSNHISDYDTYVLPMAAHRANVTTSALLLFLRFSSSILFSSLLFCLFPIILLFLSLLLLFFLLLCFFFTAILLFASLLSLLLLSSTFFSSLLRFCFLFCFSCSSSLLFSSVSHFPSRRILAL